MSLAFRDALLAIESLAGLVTYLTVLPRFPPRTGPVERLETILCAGALVWSFSPASDSDELSLIPYAE